MALRITSILVVFALALLACATPPDQVRSTGTYAPPQTFDPDLELDARAFGSEEAFAAFAKAHAGSGFLERAVMAVAEDAAVAPAAKGFSGTNVQVEGVDEGDILKTDGEYIYTVTERTLFIIRAGEDAQVVGTIEFDEAPQGLFVAGDRLAVFGSRYDPGYFREHGIRSRSGMTFLHLYDVSDRSDAKLLKEYAFEGHYFQSRMKDGDMYLVVLSGLEDRPMPMPIIMEGGAVRSVPVSDIYYYPIPYDNAQLATVHALDLDDFSLDSKAVTVEGGQTLYMSHENLYIASTEYINEWELRQQILMELLEPSLTAEDRALIAKIEAVDDDVLSSPEKESKIFQVHQDVYAALDEDARRDLDERVDAQLKETLEQYDALEYTIIHRLGINDGQVTIGPTGKVPGRLNNQFAMDEHEGVLRVATTISQRWWMPVDLPVVRSGETVVIDAEPGSAVHDVPQEEIARKIMPEPRRSEATNNVYTLDAGLNVLDSLTGLAPGEQIYSTRFMGDRLYMVTFRQVDPFFAIDLSDPRDIRELGQLKIPGFSRYLHPYDDEVIIGLGRDATEMGRQRGLKISLFDVSDVARPKEIAKWVSEEEHAQSHAEWEHKAFLFDREKELLVIPAQSYSWERDAQRYNGAMVFRVARDDIGLRGIVDHSQGRNEYGVERSLYIGDLLYTKSPNLLRINALSDLASVKNVTLPGGKGPYPVY